MSLAEKHQKQYIYIYIYSLLLPIVDHTIIASRQLHRQNNWSNVKKKKIIIIIKGGEGFDPLSPMERLESANGNATFSKKIFFFFFQKKDALLLNKA
jgi:hypothetical protein